MTDFSNIDHSSEQIFEAVLTKIQGRLEIKRKDTDVGLKLLSKFDELKKYNRLFVHKVTEVKGKGGSFMILLIEKHLTIIEPKRRVRIPKDIEEIEPVLYSVSLMILEGHTSGKETVGDKVADLFIKVDIDFTEYPGFSKNYYVAGENPEMVRKHLPRGLMESLEKIEEMTIEINGHWGLIRPEKNLTENVLCLLMSIGYKMTK